jgi:RING finger protein 170
MQDVTFECLLSTLTRYGFFFKNKLLQRVRDMPLLLRRMIWELMDPQRAIPLVHRTRILFFVWPLLLGVAYEFSKFLAA